MFNEVSASPKSRVRGSMHEDIISAEFNYVPEARTNLFTTIYRRYDRLLNLLHEDDHVFGENVKVFVTLPE